MVRRIYGVKLMDKNNMDKLGLKEQVKKLVKANGVDTF